MGNNIPSTMSFDEKFHFSCSLIFEVYLCIHVMISTLCGIEINYHLILPTGLGAHHLCVAAIILQEPKKERVPSKVRFTQWLQGRNHSLLVFII